MKNFVLTLFVSLIGAQAIAIVDGQAPDLEKSASTVYIHSDVNDYSCTGVVIASHLVLTAGHCLDHISQSTRQIKISNSRSGLRNLKDVKLAMPVRQHPQYTRPARGGRKQSEEIQYDFAFLKTKDNLQEMFEITNEQLPKLFRSTADLRATLLENIQGMAYGYGKTQNDSGSTVVENNADKRQLPMIVSYSSDNYLVARSAVLVSDGKNKPPKRKGGVCQGDSGGGLFVTRGQDVYLAGVLSGIVVGEKCGDKDSWGGYAIASDSICWVMRESAIDPVLTETVCAAAAPPAPVPAPQPAPPVSEPTPQPEPPIAEPSAPSAPPVIEPDPQPASTVVPTGPTDVPPVRTQPPPVILPTQLSQSVHRPQAVQTERLRITTQAPVTPEW